MELKIKIKHRTGSKAGQIEEFSATGGELLIGRTARCEVKYDPDLDDMVSREHAKLTVDAKEADTFWIEDNNSSNGLFVNGKKVWGKVKIYAGDMIEAGAGGPAFIFDLEPRPESHLRKTQVFNIEPARPTTLHSSVSDDASGQPEEADGTDASIAPPQPVKQGAGRETIQRIVSEERRKTKTGAMFIAAGIIILVVAGGMALWRYIGKTGSEIRGKVDTELLDVRDSLERKTGEVGRQIDEKTRPVSKTPTQIAAENSDRVVFIEMAWKLIYTPTGEDLGQLMLPVYTNGVKRLAGAFMTTEQGVEPVLITRSMDPRADIEPVRGAGTGTGFVVAPDGFILTARHVASNWLIGYHFPAGVFPGVLVNEKRSVILKSVVTPEMVGRWIPANAQNINYDFARKVVEGVNVYMDVTFARNDLRTSAKTVRISNKHDVAMIKVDLPKVLPVVELNDNYNEIKTGNAVTVLGYPGASPEQYSQTQSKDYFNTNPQLVTVPVPTLSQGNVGRLIKGSARTGSGNYYSIFGDSYQLTINSTGAGNSGGPLFDDWGRVIGVFNATNEMMTFAVPIKYGLELMGTDPVIDSQ